MAYFAANQVGAEEVNQLLVRCFDTVRILEPSTSPAPDRAYCLKTLWIRAALWMRTVAKLDHPVHIQAMSIANRAMVEFAVDMLLIAVDKTNESGRRLRIWSESERIKHFENVVAHYKRKDQPVPAQFTQSEAAHLVERDAINKERVSLWATAKNPERPRHPERWTMNNLFEDMERLDSCEVARPIIEMSIRMKLADYYREEMKPINWSIHSGVVGLWKDDDLAILYYFMGTAAMWCADFAILCTLVFFKNFKTHISLKELCDTLSAINRRRTELMKDAYRKCGIPDPSN